MGYYSDPVLARVQALINDEVRRGTHSLRASYLSRKYGLSAEAVQSVLGDLAAIGDLRTHYQLYCSGEHERFDADKEFANIEEIPAYEITCGECGDRYTPSWENIIVSFEPTDQYLAELASA